MKKHVKKYLSQRKSGQRVPGPRHRHSKHYSQTYWPYLPLMLIIAVGLLFGGPKPIHKRGVEAYAINVSSSGLLQATNSKRAASGLGSLAINGQLNGAAQAKANDMVARNYWSHETPDGQQPWVFIQNAGYSYIKAGENLAYGFLTSDETINGWMNSASHKANMLDPAYSEVGFGFANSENFVTSGQQTVVVAMYGKPQVLAVATPVVIQPTPAPAPAPTPQPAPQPPAPEVKSEEEKTPSAKPINTDATSIIEPASVPVSRVELITRGNIPWALGALGILSSLAAIVLLVRHGLAVRHVLRDGKKFVMKHPVFDTLIVSVIIAAYFLSSTSGFIR